MSEDNNVVGIDGTEIDNVEHLGAPTYGDLPIETVLKGAEEAKLITAIVVGFDNDGEFQCFSSTGDSAVMLYHAEFLKKVAMNEL